MSQGFPPMVVMGGTVSEPPGWFVDMFFSGSL
jgi:hypothetical protein